MLRNRLIVPKGYYRFEPVKLADFMVLNDNPYSVRPEEVGDIKVSMTIVGGNVVYEA